MRGRTSTGTGGIGGAFTRLAAALVAVAGTLSPVEAAAAPSALCPILAASVARGGAVAINVNACDGPFNAGVSGPVAPFAANGSVTIGQNAFGAQSVTYAHNGGASAADTFALEDNDLGVITVNITVISPASSITVQPALLPAWAVGTPIAQSLTASGGGGTYAFALGLGSALPTGLTLGTGGQISGTPTRRGPFAFDVQVTDGLGASAVKSYSGTVQNPALALSPAATTAFPGVAFSQALSASGGVAPRTISLESGALPAGLVLAGGTITGTTNAPAGNYPVTLRVTDSSTGSGTYFELKPFTVTVAAVPSVTIAVSPASVAEDGAANLVYTVTRSAALNVPTTVHFTLGGTATAGIDYTVVASPLTIPAGATSVTLLVDPLADATAEPNETVIVTIAAGTGYTVGTPNSATGTILDDDVTVSVSPASLPAATTGLPFSQAITASGGTGPYAFTVTAGTLPPGLTLAGGVLAGTPSVAGPYAFTIRATDASAFPGPYTGTRAYAVTVASGKAAQAITFGAAPSVAVGTTGTVTATGGASGNPVVITSLSPGACSIAGTTVTGLAEGTCTLAANQAGNAGYEAAPQVTQSFAVAAAATIPRLGNIATRMRVLAGDDVLIGGFIIGGTQAKTVVVRARGPSLAAAGVPGPLANPLLQLFNGPTPVAANDNWQDAANAAALSASGFAPADPLESAILITLAPGAYTGIVSGVGGTTGVGIIEIFEVDLPQVPLANISTRGRVLTGDDVMIGGFIIQGSAPKTVIVRARGPSLAAFGVPGVLGDPLVQVFAGASPIAANDNWQDGPDAAAIQAAGFAPSSPFESAVRLTLAPGAYTVIVTGVGGTTGVAIVEVFAQ